MMLRRTFLLALLVALAALVGLGVSTAAESSTTIRNVVLVHGALSDGSGWRGVYDVLTKDGFRVSVVQLPLTGFSDDVAATQRVLDRQDGPTLLVGHSYGGTIITVAGAHPRVAALVYIAALQPDVGETTNTLAASMPGLVSPSELQPSGDGYIFFNPERFAAEVAADVPPALADFLAHAQKPVAAAAFDAPVPHAAWRDKPSFAVVATDDRELNPVLARWMYRRSASVVTEIKASHLVYISQPEAVANVIEHAARSFEATAAKAR
jgi:pimeloyl-ACP methyl ester carboxylesterase